MDQDRSQLEYQDEIALLAYSYWEDRGCQDGYDVEDWLRAEEEVQRRREAQPVQHYQARTAA